MAWRSGLGLGFQGRQLRYFTVMCKDDVEIRASPTYADDARVGHFLHPGQVLVVDDRRMAGLLRAMARRGWSLPLEPANDRLLVMTEVQEFERGYSDDARTGVVCHVLPGDCIAVDERCTVANARCAPQWGCGGEVSEIGRWPGLGLRDEGPPSRDERGQTWSPSTISFDEA
eukprot:Skav209745  [mRNA]  locus=scaffold9:18591:20533:+ [translate_table: standard]